MSWECTVIAPYGWAGIFCPRATEHIGHRQQPSKLSVQRTSRFLLVPRCYIRPIEGTSHSHAFIPSTIITWALQSTVETANRVQPRPAPPIGGEVGDFVFSYSEGHSHSIGQPRLDRHVRQLIRILQIVANRPRFGLLLAIALLEPTGALLKGLIRRIAYCNGDCSLGATVSTRIT
jgi:hypothetical protein